MALSRYLAALKAQLPGGLADPDLLDEVQGHLEECVRDLQLAGLSRVESEEEAARRFGLPADVAGAFKAVAPAGGRARRGPRTLVAAGLVALALAGTLGGGMAAASLSRPALSPPPPSAHVSPVPRTLPIAPR